MNGLAVSTNVVCFIVGIIFVL